MHSFLPWPFICQPVWNLLFHGSTIHYVQIPNHHHIAVFCVNTLHHTEHLSLLLKIVKVWNIDQ
jgi:hypothetical protein